MEKVIEKDDTKDYENQLFPKVKPSLREQFMLQ